MTTKTVPRNQPALVNAVDPLGRPIEPCVVSVAQEIAPQAVAYAQKSLADPCVATNLLEEATATVSEAVLAKHLAELPPIRDMRAYLYRAFLRRLAAKRQAEIRLEEAFEERLLLNESMSFQEKLEARLLLKQILCMCDRKTMWIVWERSEGRSWDEIAYDCVTQLLRQNDSKVFKKYSQMKLRMQREALDKMNRQANEMTVEVTTAVQESGSLCTVPAQF
jgi:hypothetical protein